MERLNFDACYGVRTDGQIHLAALNLDSMGVDDLCVAVEHPALHMSVRDYASLKLAAIDSRESGRTERAMRLEGKADSLYDQMPCAVQW